MIIEVFKDIKVFLIILFISIFAFTNSFMALFEDVENDNKSFIEILITVVGMTMGEPDPSLIVNLALIIIVNGEIFRMS